MIYFEAKCHRTFQKLERLGNDNEMLVNLTRSLLLFNFPRKLVSYYIFFDGSFHSFIIINFCSLFWRKLDSLYS
jgi:hypothetical protein